MRPRQTRGPHQARFLSDGVEARFWLARVGVEPSNREATVSFVFLCALYGSFLWCGSGSEALSVQPRPSPGWSGFPDKKDVKPRIHPHSSPLIGVTPSVETVGKVPGCRSLEIARRTGWVCPYSRPTEEAEASSAGEQLAKEYSAGTHRDDETGGVQRSSRFGAPSER